MIYHPLVRANLTIDTTLLRPGHRLGVGLSGGADSVALLCAMHERNAELGLVLHAVHLHHGLRGEEADADQRFAQALAEKLKIPFHHAEVDTANEARADAAAQKSSESIEEAARRLRYGWFRQLLASGAMDAVATAHTMDDQAETVLAKFLRGAWTEGLSGIHPVLDFPEGRVVRPFLATTRVEIEAYLRAIGQDWREDSSNRHLGFTRNRIRHELLPLLETWNLRLREHMAQMSELARDEEAWWDSETSRVAAELILPGRPVRGGGRAGDTGLALDITRFAALHPAMQRRLLRRTAGQLGAALDFSATESLRELALRGRAGEKREVAHGLKVERTHREIRFGAGHIEQPGADHRKAAAEYVADVPGQVEATAFGISLRIERTGLDGGDAPVSSAILRKWKAGDRVRVRHSRSARKVKEVLERMKVTGSDRVLWPVLEYRGEIVWMQGVELEPVPGLLIKVLPLPGSFSNEPR